MTEEHLLAREEDGAASIVEVYAALLLGFITESDLAQQQVGTQNAHPCTTSASLGATDSTQLEVSDLTCTFKMRPPCCEVSMPGCCLACSLSRMSKAHALLDLKLSD